jgi:MoxR-like ATPase
VANSWRVYTGIGQPGDGSPPSLPAPPPWRLYDGAVPLRDRPIQLGAEPNGAKFQASDDVIEAVNAALHLRRPLLITGRPGSGKSMLIESVANELSLGRVLRWHITSASTLKDSLYRYDAVGRLHEHQLHGAAVDVAKYISLGPLGTALLPTGRPRALLIDEIDKAVTDLPNDLLNVFERGEFEIPELARVGGTHDVRAAQRESHEVAELYPIVNGLVRCAAFPFVVLTSNGEREFPAAFLRRCIRFRMPPPSPKLLTDIVSAHLGADVAAECSEMILEFAERASDTRALAIDQLMNAIFIVTRQLRPSSEERARVVELLQKRLETDST